MRLNGITLRLLLLALLIAVLALYSVREALGDEQDVYLCETDTTMRQCNGPEDDDTCADLGVPCVQSACGFKLAHHIDVSVAGADDPLDEDGGTPINIVSGFMIMWSMVPYALFPLMLGCFLIVGDATTLSVLLLCCSIAVINEFGLKRLVLMHRPEGSCIYFESYGMPSSHSATALGVLWDLLLEVWVDRPEISLTQKAYLTAMAVAFLGPVPYSRVYLHDHTLLQVGVGAGAGFIIGTLWFLVMYQLVRPRLDRWVQGFCCRCFRLRNTYRNDEAWLPNWTELDTSALFEEETTIMNNLSGGAAVKTLYAKMKDHQKGDKEAKSTYIEV